MSQIIVSGCPRSGTSLTMRILEKAGLPIAVDNKREADSDNVHGYFEIDDIINKLRDNPELVHEYKDQVLKVTHFGIQYLLPGEYKIVYIERNINEVLASMEKMSGKQDPDPEETRDILIRYNEKVKKMMEERNDISYIKIHYSELLSDPGETINRIIQFLAINPTKKEEMMTAIDKSSYRNKS